MIYLLKPHHYKHFLEHGIKVPTGGFLSISDEEYNRHDADWRETFPEASQDEIHTRILAHAQTARQHKEHPQNHRLELRIIAFLILLLLILLLSTRAHAQFSHVNTITVTDGSTSLFTASPFQIMFSGCTVSGTSSAMIVTCTGGPGGSGTVTSVGDLSPLFTTATRTTTPAFSLTAAAAHTILGNNTAGSAAPTYFVPACASLSDFGPFCNGTAYSSLTGTPQLAVTKAAVASNWLNSYTSSTGVFTATQPAFTDISGTATDVQLANAYSGVGTPTACSNQFVTGLTLTRNAAPTSACTTATLASAQFANQGATTTVLHGNAAGNPAFGAVVQGDVTNGYVDLSSTQATIAGAKTFTTSLALTNAGVFTNTQQNEYQQSVINGCSPSTEYNTVNTSQFATDGATGCVSVSNGATVNAANGLSGYVNNASLATTPNGVGVYGQGRATGLNANVWGGSFVAADSSGIASNQLTGLQAAINVQNTASVGNALAIEGKWTAQPANANGIIITKPQSTGSWTQGINIAQGATTTTTSSQSALLFNPVASGTNQPSQGIEFLAGDPVSGQNAISMVENPSGYLLFSNSAPGSGIIAKQTTGLFTSGQTNDTNEFWTNGIDPTAQVKIDFTGTSYMGNSISTGIAIPASPGNFEYNGLGSFVTNASGATSAGVALFGLARATSTNARVWGMNSVTADVLGTPTSSMYGAELDLNVNNTTSLNGTGILLTGGSSVQPTSGTRAINVAVLGPSVHWHYGLKFEQAATVTPDANNAAVYFGPIASGVNQISQGMTFLDNDTTSGQNTATVWETAAGNLLFSFSKASTGIQGNAFQLSFQRSGGNTGFPDIVGTGAARLILGDSFGVGAPSGLFTGTTPPACTAGTAGFMCNGEGTAPTNVASTAAIYPSSTTHEYMAATNGASTATPGMMVRVQPSPINNTAKTAAVTTATLCASAAGACNTAGQYRLTYNVWGSGTACATVTAGSLVLNFTWTDENAVTHTTINAPMWDQKTSAMTAGQVNFNTALGTEGGSGSFIISTNGTIIQYATTYTACTSGTGTYNLRIAAERLQ